MQDTLRSSLEDAKKWNLSGVPWWIIDFTDTPEALYCSEQMAVLFGLDPAAEKHLLADIFVPNQAHSSCETALQTLAFTDRENSDNWGDECYQSAFQWYDADKKSYSHFNNTIRILERDASGLPNLLYGVVENIKESSHGPFDTLLDHYFDELITEHGYGYKWVVDLETQRILPDTSMARLHGGGWIAGQWYPFAGIYDWTPQEHRQQVERDTDNFCQAIKRGESPELNVIHPHFHALTKEVRWYNVRGRHVVIDGRNYSVGISVDVTA